jgi:methyl-accepting chemotaxis protein
MNDNRLARVFFQHEGKLSDKWEQYLSIYETELKRFVEQGKPVRLLEIGVQNGGSLEIWAKYLPTDSIVIGVDIDPAVQKLHFEGNVRAFVADVNDCEEVERLIGAEPFDIIIDDGSHTSSDIIAAFKNLFPRVAPGGKYIVEDLHASYWSSHGGGLRLRSSSMEYLKDIVDALNADYFDPKDSVSDAEGVELKRLGRQLGRITFYNSVAVIEKLVKEKEQPYRHLIGGQHALVNDPLNFIVAAPNELLQPWLLGETAARSINLALKDALEKQLQEVLTKLNDALSHAETLRTRNEALAAKFDETQAELAQTRSDIHAILNSTSWRATAALRRAASMIRR